MSGLVKVGITEAIALSWLPTLLHRLTERYPKIKVELVVGLSIHLWQHLAEGTIDLGLLAGTATHPHLICRPLGVMTNRWMASPDLLDGHVRCTAAEITEWPIIITHSHASHLMVEMQQWFRTQGVQPGRLIGCNNMASSVKLACAAIGVGVFPPAAASDALEEGRLVLIETSIPFGETNFVAAFSDEGPQAPTMAVVEQACKVSHSYRQFNY